MFWARKDYTGKYFTVFYTLGSWDGEHIYTEFYGV